MMKIWRISVRLKKIHLMLHREYRGGCRKKNPEEDFVLVSGNTSKNNFSFSGVTFKVAKEKNKVDLELEEDEEENSDMPNFKKKKKKKNKGNDFFYNFLLLDKKRSVTEELEQLFAKDKEVIERKKNLLNKELNKKINIYIFLF